MRGDRQKSSDAAAEGGALPYSPGSLPDVPGKDEEKILHLPERRPQAKHCAARTNCRLSAARTSPRRRPQAAAGRYNRRVWSLF